MVVTESLLKKVTLGLKCHSNTTCVCCDCPYNNVGYASCSETLALDARNVIDYYSTKHCEILNQKPVILHDPTPIRIEPVDVKATLKAIKAMNRMEKAARTATEAMSEATKSVKELRKELNEFDKK